MTSINHHVNDADFYYAKTTNMKKAEDQLLKSSDWSNNHQKQSNRKEEKGYVYVIKNTNTSTENNLCDQFNKMNIK